jgi:ACS family glucarate transporter-like MFS transporter
MNMAGNLGALLTSLAFPYLLVWTGSPSPFFVLAATLNVLAIFCWQKTTAKTLQEEASDE